MNQGLDTGRGKDFLALNPDTLVPAGAIVKALAELERHPDVGMLGVKLIRPDGTFDHACKRGFPTVSSALYYFLGLSRLFPRSARFARYTAGELGQNETGTVDAINGAFMLVKREAVEDVGPMDERYWLYAEDIDWCHRFWDEGWKVLYWPAVRGDPSQGRKLGRHSLADPQPGFSPEHVALLREACRARAPQGAVRAGLGRRVDEVRPLRARKHVSACSRPRLERGAHGRGPFRHRRR